MMQYVDSDFQQKIDQFNAVQGGPAKIAVAWNPKLNRWQIFVIPQNDSAHPMARNDITSKMIRPLPDDSSRDGILLFTWQTEKQEFKPLDDRLFITLKWADSFTDRHHFEKTIEEPTLRREMAEKAALREIAYAARSYWYGYDRVVKNMNPAVSSPGDWRSARNLR